jgi:hypothetical protein
MMTKHFYRGMLLLLLSLFATASDEAGGRAGAYLRMPPDARSAALGNAVGTIVNDVNMLSSNPALVSFFEEKQFSSSFQFLSLDRTYQSLGFAAPLPPKAGMSVNWIHAGVGNIVGRNYSNDPTYEYRWSKDAFLVVFGMQVTDWLSLGVSGKILSDKLINSSASGFSADIGMLLSPVKDLRIAAVVKDITGKVTWDISEESYVDMGSRRVDYFPNLLQIGASYLLSERYLFAAAYRFTNEIEPSWHAGVEARIGQGFFLRAGADNGSPVFGFATAFPIWGDQKTRLDYAYKNGSVHEGGSHLFTWLFCF